VEVVVRYAGHPGRFSYAGESNWLASRREVVTMNEPHMAPWWFPSNDHPRDKARMDFHITAPNGREVVANGLPIGRDSGPSRTTWHWRVAEPMVPYLAFFAAGDFAVARGRADGRPWLVAVSQHLPAGWRRDSMTMLRRTPQVVRWLESELGDYPFGTTGGLVTSLNPGFALENQTRPTYPPLTPGDTYLLVHELAHQWFGDDVAVRSWRDIWLNEGFATYLEKRYDETHGGQSAATWLRNRYDALGGGSSFWSLPVADPGPGHLFDAAVYLRGAMTLQALRHRIGGAEFRTLLRTWVRVHARGNGSTAQFRALAEQVSGEDLTGFFDAWLVSTTKPADIVANGLG
jgi:aminopeptidase N